MVQQTTKLCKMAIENDDSLIFSFTNKAVENVKQNLRKSLDEATVNKICHTFDSYFCDYHERGIVNLKKQSHLHRRIFHDSKQMDDQTDFSTNVVILKTRKKRKELKFEVKIEKEDELKKRIGELEQKIKIKDDTTNKYFYIDHKFNKKRIKTKVRYSKRPKDKALNEIKKVKQNKINELTLNFH